MSRYGPIKVQVPFARTDDSTENLLSLLLCSSWVGPAYIMCLLCGVVELMSPLCVVLCYAGGRAYGQLRKGQESRLDELNQVQSQHILLYCCSVYLSAYYVHNSIPSRGLHVNGCVYPCLCVLQQYLTGGDYDDVEDLENKLESYKS